MLENKYKTAGTGPSQVPDCLLISYMCTRQHEHPGGRWCLTVCLYRTRVPCSQAQATADDWYRRAQLALTKGDEELAKEALVRRKSYQASWY